MASIYPAVSDPVLASIGWPVCDLHTGPGRVQLKPLESGTWTKMKGLLYLRGWSIYVTGASPGSWRVCLNGVESVCGFLLLHY